MKLLPLVLVVLTVSDFGFSKSVNNDVLDEIKTLLEHEERQPPPTPEEEVTYKFARVFMEKRDNEKTEETDTIELNGEGTMAPAENPVEQDLSETPQNPFADPYNGLDKAEYEAAAQKVKLATQIDQAVAGVQVTDVEATNIVGDMVLNDKAATELLQDAVASQTNSKRKMAPYGFSKWPNKHVPYVIDYSYFTSDNVQNIEKAIAIWQEQTCLTFTEGAPVKGAYLYFNAEKGGCFASLGHTGRKQTINLANGCRGIATILHEIAHALGMWHEQMRPGRDAYIQVVTSNISPKKMGNFEKVSDALIYGVPYDYGSVMHYGGQAFASDYSKLTLQTHDPLFQSTIGQRNSLSFFDKILMNRHYECIPDCPSLLCQNGGYPLPTSKCAKCVCPEGYGGEYCQTAGPRSSGCNPSNGEIMATNAKQCVNSPNYPQRYSNDDTCNWLITAKNPNKRIEWSFEGDRFYVAASGGVAKTCMHWVEIKDSKNTTLRGMRFCGSNKPQVVRVSETDKMVVSFNGESGSYGGTGFKLCFQQTDKSATGAGKTGENPCISGPCQNGGVCNRKSDTEYTCSCKQGYEGTNCDLVKPVGCSTSPCKNGGTCVSVSGTVYYCKCTAEYTGEHCDTKDKEASCVSSPCLNGGQCSGYAYTNYGCPSYGACKVNSRKHYYSCFCKGGYNGKNCQNAPPAGCSSSPCLNGGQCQSLGSGYYYCSCGSSWTGEYCQTAAPTPCAPNPCSGYFNRCGSYRSSTRYNCASVGACVPASTWAHYCY